MNRLSSVRQRWAALPNSSHSLEHFETVIIGGGQAGLSVGYHLGRRDRPFVILDANERIGDPWRKRWDSRSTCSPPPNTAGWRVGRSRRLPRHFRRRTR